MFTVLDTGGTAYLFSCDMKHCKGRAGNISQTTIAGFMPAIYLKMKDKKL